MADFKQAVEWMKEGKKVRRKDWTMDTEDNSLILNNHFLGWDKTTIDPTLTSMDYLATDWEIYEEKNSLSDKHVTCTCSASQTWMYNRPDVKEAVKKLKREIAFAVKEKAGKYDFNGEGFKDYNNMSQNQLAIQNQLAFINEFLIRPIDKIFGEKLV